MTWFQVCCLIWMAATTWFMKATLDRQNIFEEWLKNLSNNVWRKP